MVGAVHNRECIVCGNEIISFPQPCVKAFAKKGTEFMLNRLIQSLKSKKGEGYFEVMFCTVVIVLGITCGLNIFSIMLQKKSLDNAADQLVRCIQVNGEINQTLDEMYTELTSGFNAKPTMKVEAAYYNGTKKVQLRQPITVKLSMETEVLGFPVTILGKGVGINEVYQKD